VGNSVVAGNSSQNKIDKSKRKGVCFGGKVLMGKKSPPLFLGQFYILTHHFLCFCFFFFSVAADLVGKQCGRRLGGQLVNSLQKSTLRYVNTTTNNLLWAGLDGTFVAYNTTINI
jgi:hypothetical protein